MLNPTKHKIFRLQNGILKKNYKISSVCLRAIYLNFLLEMTIYLYFEKKFKTRK